ncbi:MAG: UbiD family decarboxylase [Candidatus Tectomicrobia bacterium]|nr:UbiD family decarboxylase [Candidatus Tectomicrobia bacterium]
MQDLRTYLETARRLAPGNYLEITEAHDINLEVCALVGKLEKQRRYPLLCFTKINDLSGEPSKFPILMNAFASRGACAMALGLPPEKSGLDLVLEFQRREARREKPLVIRRQEAPVKEVVADPNLFHLPILTHHLEDKGPYLTMTWSARDPDTGVYNSSFHRCYVRDPNHVVMFFERRHLWDYYVRAERRNEPLPVACVIGHHPAYYLGNCVLTGITEDEYESIGGLMGEPLRLVPSETFGEELLVPADAEMIIEGRLLPQERGAEGPFGDFTGFYGAASESPMVEITAITHRRDAYCMSIFVGHPEHRLLGAIPKEGSIYRKVQSIVPTVTGVCLPISGAGRFHCYISIEKRCDGEPKLAAMAAFTASELIKHVIVVDHDIDVYDEEQVLWAMASRVDAATDIEILNRVKGSRLDPVHPGKDWGSKLIIDACENDDIDFPNRIATAEYRREIP